MAEHGCSEIGNMFGGYDCVCGAPWLTSYCSDDVDVDSCPDCPYGRYCDDCADKLMKKRYPRYH